MLAIQEMEAKHNTDLEENRAILEQKIPQVYKQSSELLNLKKIQDGLVRQKEYAEAHKVQQKIFELEKEEQEKYQQVRQKKIVAAETLLIQKQQQQMNALRKKVEGGLAGDRTGREQQHEKMLQRYQNVKKELETQQNLERIKLEKLFGKQLLASQTSLSYGQKKSDMSYSSKGFQTASPKKTFGGATRADNGPASNPSHY